MESLSINSNLVSSVHRVERKKTKMILQRFGSHVNQCLASISGKILLSPNRSQILTLEISANILNILTGFSFAWFELNKSRFPTKETPLQVPPLDPDEVKWIRSAELIGACVGALFLCFVGDILGRKNTLTFLSIPYLVRCRKIYCILKLISKSKHSS